MIKEKPISKFKLEKSKTKSIKKKGSEIDFENFFIHSIELLCVIDDQGYFRKLNPEWEKTLGYKKSEIIGNKFIDFVHPDDVEKTLVATNGLVKNKKLHDFENRYQRKNGGYVCLKWKAYLKDNMFYASAKDITELKSAENELQTSKQNFSDIFNLSPDMVGITRQSDGMLFSGNPAFTQITGYKPEEYIGHTTIDLHLWANPKNREEMLKLLIEKGNIRNLEMELQIKNGTILTCLFSASPIKYNNEPCLIYVLHDITERKHAEEAIKKSEARLQKAQAIGQIGYSEQVIDSPDVWSSSEGMRIFGFPPIEGFIPFEKVKACLVDFESFLKSYRDLLEKGKKFDIEYIINPADGSPQRYIHEVLDLERDAEGKPYKFIGIFQDITKHKKAEEALKKSEEQFKGIVQNIPGVVYQLLVGKDGEAKVNYISDNTTKYSGLDIQDPNILEHFIEGIVEEDRERFITSRKKAAETLTQWEWEGKYISPGGKELWFHGLSQPRLLNNELVFDGIIFDITESKMAEKELAETKILFDTAIMQTPVPMIIVSKSSYKFQASNHACEEFLGIQLSDYIGKSLMEITPAWQDYDEFGNIVPMSEMPISLALQGIETKNKEYFVKRKDGTIRWESVSASTIRNSNGDIIAAYLVFPDITERKEAEEKIKELADLNKTILSTLTVGLTLLKNRRQEWVNLSQCRIFGYEYEEMVNSDTSKLYANVEDFKKVGDEGYGKLAKGEVYSIELPMKKKDGTIFWCSLVGKALNPKDISEGSIWVLQDINERKLAEETLLKNAQEKEWLMKSMANGFVMWETVFDDTNRMIDVRFSYINDTYERFAGIKLDQVKGKRITEVFPETEPGWFDIFNEIAHSGKSKHFEMFFKHTNSLYSCTAYLPWNTADRICVIFEDITEQKKSEEKFKQLASLHQTILDTVSVGIIYVKNRKMQWVNRAFYKLYGYTLDDVFDKETSILYISEDDYKRVGNEAYSLLKKGDVVSTELLGRKKDGSMFWVNLNGKAIDPEKPMDGSIWVIQDISTRKNAELSLKKNEAILKATMESMNDGLLVVTDENIITHYNTRFKQIFSVPDELLYTHTNENVLNHAKLQLVDPEEFYNQVKNIYPTDSTTEDILHFADGRIIERYSFSLTEDSPERGRVWLFRDITERKKTEDVLVKNQTWLRESQRVAQIGSWEFFFRENRLVWNEEAYHIYGYKYLEINPTIETFIGLVHPDDRMFIQSHLEKSQQSNQFNDFECRIIRPDGVQRVIFIVGAVTTDENGKTFRSYGIVQDITERKMAEDAIKMQDAKLKSIFLAAPVAIGLTINRAFQECNDSFYKMTGYSKDEIIGKNARMIYPTKEEYIHIGQEQIRQMQNQGTGTVETRWLRKDGSIIIILLRFVPLEPSDLQKGVTFSALDITERKQYEEALKKHVLALTRPLGELKDIQFTDLFNIEDLQKIQDSFSEATGVASLITYPNGIPITKPSNFSNFCNLIRGTKIGQIKCFKSDAYLGKENPNGATIRPCLSGGIWEAGASITLGGVHLANWLIGQVRNEAQNEDELVKYADKIGIDQEKFRKAYNEVPFMSAIKFEKVSQYMYILANELSIRAYQNVQQARFITEQKVAEESIRKSEEQFRGIAQNIPGTVFQFFARDNGEIGLNFVTELSMKYLGLDNSLDNFYDRFVAGIADEDRSKFVSSVQEAIKAKSRWEFEGKYIRPDEVNMYFRGIAQPRKIGIELVFDGLILDITERKQAELEIIKLNIELEKKVEERTIKLIEANKELESFAYSVSHDLRAPLRHIDGFIRIMYSNIKDPTDTLTSYFDKINSASKRMSSMIDNLLSFSRLTRKEISRHMVNTETLVHEIIDLFKPETEKLNIKWTIGNLPEVNGDKSLLRMVFENLISNAIKYSSKNNNAIIEIGSNNLPDQIEYFIKDNGVGFDMNYVDKLFGVFQRLHSNEEFEGTGVGLANVKQIITKHGGTVRAEGKVNEGATFYISLPK